MPASKPAQGEADLALGLSPGKSASQWRYLVWTTAQHAFAELRPTAHGGLSLAEPAPQQATSRHATGQHGVRCSVDGLPLLPKGRPLTTWPGR